jgi:hypothetical protein
MEVVCTELSPGSVEDGEPELPEKPVGIEEDQHPVRDDAVRSRCR